MQVTVPAPGWRKVYKGPKNRSGQRPEFCLDISYLIQGGQVEVVKHADTSPHRHFGWWRNLLEKGSDRTISYGVFFQKADTNAGLVVYGICFHG